MRRPPKEGRPEGTDVWLDSNEKKLDNESGGVKEGTLSSPFTRKVKNLYVLTKV